MTRVAVAPLVGAWIEITFMRCSSSVGSVAPLVGAWIEISSDLSYSKAELVAPLVGAWIEIKRSRYHVWRYGKSLLSWERGLKSYEPLASLSQVVSLLSWERGLK